MHNEPHAFVFCNSSQALCDCGLPADHELHKPSPSGWKTIHQRDDLPTCPFCNTKALEQHRNKYVRIICGNPFCEMVCHTQPVASTGTADEIWKERV